VGFAYSEQATLTSTKLRLAFLALIWFAGFGAGLMIYRSAQTVLVSVMLGASHSTLSIVGLLLMILLPILITVIAVHDSKPALLYVLCFLKAVLYSVAVLSVYGTYGSSGWLVQFLLMFTENCTMACLWLLWIHSILTRFRVSQRIVWICSGAALSAGLLDLFVISPFAVSVMII